LKKFFCIYNNVSEKIIFCYKLRQVPNFLKFKTFSIKEGQLEKLKKLLKEIRVPQSLLIRIVIDDLLKDEEGLKKKLFSR